MRYFAAFQSLIDAQKVEASRLGHLEFLENMLAAGRIVLRGRFTDGSGGLTIFTAETLEEAREIAERDPYVSSGARRLELHEWEMKPRPGEW
jgi:uncharacterized protein